MGQIGHRCIAKPHEYLGAGAPSNGHDPHLVENLGIELLTYLHKMAVVGSKHGAIHVKISVYVHPQAIAQMSVVLPPPDPKRQPNPFEAWQSLGNTSRCALTAGFGIIGSFVLPLALTGLGLGRLSAIVIGVGIFSWATVSSTGHYMEVRIWRLIWSFITGIRLHLVSWIAKTRHRTRRNPWWIILSTLVTVFCGSVILFTFEPPAHRAILKAFVPESWFEPFEQGGLLLWFVILIPILKEIVEKVGDWGEAYDTHGSAVIATTLLELRRKFNHVVVNVRAGEQSRGRSGRSEECHANITRELADAVRNVFIELSDVKGAKVKVHIFSVEGSAVDKVLAVSPANEGTLSLMEDIRDNKSAVSRCIASKRILVIQNIEQELALGKASKYHQSPTNPGGCKGSLICFPLRLKPEGRVAAAVCIQSPQKNLFLNGLKEQYTRELESFEADYMESYILKEKPNAPEH